ncbi:hypothetical protein B9T16_10360 [Arthrospira sp. PCC 8006]|uniref:hypothetical protein n=1 Tax=Oscillatoriales TaxID=1150 RepID=UPI00396D2542
MNPEDIISAFLSVWENNPELFNNPEVSESLGDLQKQLAELETASDEEIADCLEDWLSDYEAITNAVDAASTRKLSGSDNDSPNTGDTAYENLYPKITEILRTRAPKIGKKEGQSQSS